MRCSQTLILQKMYKFYFFLWLNWAIRLSICSIVTASLLAVIITFFIYLNQGAAELSKDVANALVAVFVFWFPLAWSLTLLVALFRSLKYIFNRCINGYELKLLACTSNKETTSEVLEVIGYGDLLKVWRKWFMLIIWLVGSMMIIALAFTYMVTSYSGVFEWFSIYWLYSFVLISGYFSFILMNSRCKSVKVMKC